MQIAFKVQFVYKAVIMLFEKNTQITDVSQFQWKFKLLEDQLNWIENCSDKQGDADCYIGWNWGAKAKVVNPSVGW